MLTSYQMVKSVESRINRNTFGESFSLSLFIHTVPTTSEGRIALQKKRNKQNNVIIKL